MVPSTLTHLPTQLGPIQPIQCIIIVSVFYLWIKQGRIERKSSERSSLCVLSCLLNYQVFLSNCATTTAETNVGLNLFKL